METERLVLDIDVASTSPGLARRAVREYSLRHQVDGATLDAALLIATELVTNAVRHGEEPITLCLQLLGDGALRVEVCDAGTMVEPLAGLRSGELATTGRGLAIVSEYAKDWRVERRPHGKSVTADIAEPSA
jgi:anti-sigma regulatory factor (Ser/Thr protein kinase)